MPSDLTLSQFVLQNGDSCFFGRLEWGLMQDSQNGQPAFLDVMVGILAHPKVGVFGSAGLNGDGDIQTM